MTDIEDPAYDDARHVWNGLIDRSPTLIIRPTGTADVVEAVNFAREHHLLLSVRGGGHNVAGNAVNDDGVVIDLSSMRGVFVEPARRTARVQGGATWGDVDRETQVHGLATTGGQVSTTGVAGLTLHGGLGVLHRKYGLTIETSSPWRSSLPMARSGPRARPNTPICFGRSGARAVTLAS